MILALDIMDLQLHVYAWLDYFSYTYERNSCVLDKSYK